MNPSIQTAHAAQVLPARGMLFLAIVAFHVVLAYLFASGLITQTIRIMVPDRMKVVPIEPERPKAPPVENPTVVPPPITIAHAVLPDPDLPPINMEPDNTAISVPMMPGTTLTPVVPPEPAPLPLRLVGRNVMPNSADYYPPQKIREGTEGSAEVRSCVSPAGKLDGTPTIEASSGDPSLDKAAVRLARDGKYARAMRGDTPVPNCYRFRVTFTLH
jgi:TonB family protein